MRGILVQPRYWNENHGPDSVDGWAHLGDLGFVDEEGYLHVIGRLKDIIIRGGTNINPYEVEALVRGHLQVLDVCVVGIPHHELGEVAVAFVVLRTGAQLVMSDLQQFLAERGLARYKWLEAPHVLPELPLSGPGKVDRRILREIAAAKRSDPS